MKKKEREQRGGKWSNYGCAREDKRGEKKKSRTLRKSMIIVVGVQSGKWTGIPDRREWFRFHRQGSRITAREKVDRYFTEFNVYLFRATDSRQ